MVERWNIDLFVVGIICGAAASAALAFLPWRALERGRARAAVTSAAPAIALAALVAAALDGRPPIEPMIGLAAAGAWCCIGSGRDPVGRIGAVALLSTGFLAASRNLPAGIAAVGLICAASAFLLPRRPDGRSTAHGGAQTPAAGSAVALAVAACLWTSTPDTEGLAVVMGALLVPALLEASTGSLRRPDPVASATILLIAAIDFRGRPAGVAILVVAAAMILGASRRGPMVVRQLDRSAAATAISLLLLLGAARTGGLRFATVDSIRGCAPAALAIAILAVTVPPVAAISLRRRGRAGSRPRSR